MLSSRRQCNMFFYFCTSIIIIICLSFSRENMIRNILTKGKLMSDNLMKIKDQNKSFVKLIERLTHGKNASCADIFDGNITIPWTKSQNDFSEKFKKGYQKIMKDTRNNFPEGHSNKFKDQVRIYYEIVQCDFVKTVCETGFNAGHSTFTWLNSNPHIHVYSFDIGTHNYSRPMAAFLQELFPNRLHITYGDSRVTLPDFQRKYKIQCDVIIIDGGHFGNVPKADFDNFYQMKNNLIENILIIDDWPSKIFSKVGASWNYALNTGQAKLIRQCFRERQMDKQQGITIGQLI